MQEAFLLLIGAASLLLGGGIAIVRARHEQSRSGHVSITTAGAVFAAYLGPTLCALLASWWSLWAMRIPARVAAMVGGVLIVTGLLVYGVARTEFKTSRRVWGLRTDVLITTGIYSRSRNPQLVGWMLFLLGAATAGGSALALLLIAMCGVACVVAVRAEEQALVQRFGADYQRYCKNVPRYVGAIHASRCTVFSGPIRRPP